MTVAHLRRVMSGDEWTGWIALNNLRAKEAKAAEGKRRRGRR